MLFYVESGSSLSDAPRRYPTTVPNTVLYLVRIAEEVGRLEDTLRDVSEHLRCLDHILSDTKPALLYPAFVFATMGTAMVFWFNYVVPKMVGLLADRAARIFPGFVVRMIGVGERSGTLPDQLAYVAEEYQPPPRRDRGHHWQSDRARGAHRRRG